MAINSRPSLDTSLLASSIPYKPRAFVIGPFATRVNFASQQRRALNVVWAIHDDLRKAGRDSGLRGKDVCIVGAGLAGLTAAVAVSAFGGNAWILEKEREVFHRMREAGHREVHPTINFWPQEKVNPSTFLPFFNWHQDGCNAVLSKIWTEWEELKRQPGIKGITPSCTVDDFRLEGEKWKIEATLDAGKTLPRDNFDALILATGFGDEKFSDGSTSPGYWEENLDRIKAIQDTEDNPCSHYIVSGTGDGGIIEVLRLLFTGFRAGGIEAVMNAIMGDQIIPNEIMKIERDVQHKLTDHLLHESFPIDDDALNGISKYYWGAYNKVVKSGRLAGFFEEKMEEMRTCVDRVVLLGVRETPLDMNQSPFHKLLLTFAFRKGWLEYYQVPKGNLTVDDCGCATGAHALANSLRIELKTVEFTPTRKVWFDGDKRRSRIFTKLQHMDCSFHLSRHGYTSPIDEFFPVRSSRMAEFIRHRQALYADQDFLTEDQADYFASQLGKTPPSSINDWIEDYIEELKAYFVDRHGIDIKRVTSSSSDESAAVDSVAVQLVRGENYDREKFLESQWMIPPKFYGIDVRKLDGAAPVITNRGGF